MREIFSEKYQESLVFLTALLNHVIRLVPKSPITDWDYLFILYSYRHPIQWWQYSTIQEILWNDFSHALSITNWASISSRKPSYKIICFQAHILLPFQVLPFQENWSWKVHTVEKRR